MIILSKAVLTDIPAMQKLADEEIKKGVILRRTDDEVATNIRSYIVAKDDENIVGYAALHIHSARLAEIRSLVVDKAYRGRNIGRDIVRYGIMEAKELGAQEVLVLTYVPAFFERMGFSEIDKESIPEHKIWADCIKCIHFPACNEISLKYTLGQES